MIANRSATTLLLAAFAALSQASGQTTVWLGTNNTNWNPPPNWSGSPGDATTLILFDGTATRFELSLNGDRAARGLAFSGGSDYSLTGSGNTLSLGTAGISHTGTGNHTLDFTTLAFGNNVGAGDISVSGAGTLTINSNITGGGGVALNKSGSGLLVLTGNNSYSGPSTISGGVLRITNGSALGASVFNNTVQSGATLQLAGNFTLNQANLTLAGTGSAGLGALNSLSGTQTFAGSLSIDSALGATLSAENGATFTHTGAINGGAVTTSGAGTINLGGAINISGFNANGSGTLNLTGGSSLNISAFNVNAGTVVLNRNANANLLNTSFVVNGGTLRLGANEQIADFQTLRANAGGTVDLNGFDETIARLRLEGGALATGSGLLRLPRTTH
jgi:autotransporter-associated beta strand protein